MNRKKHVTGRGFDDNVRGWKKEIAPFERHPYTIGAESTALLVIDMQRYFTEKGGHAYLPATEDIMPRLQRLIAGFRKHGAPVVFTRHSHKKGEEGVLGIWWHDTIREGSEGSEIDPRLDVGSCPVIRKTRYSAFFGTGLERILWTSGVRTVVISGVMTHLCCDTTARDAFVRDFQVVFLMDATATSDEELHVSALRGLADGFAEVLTCTELERRLGWRKG